MSLALTPENPVHFPKDEDLFQFDDEVAAIFENMAARAIPMYAEVHRMHVGMYLDYFKPGAVIADIGSSTGTFFRTIQQAKDASLHRLGVTAYAVDVSQPMMDRLSSAFPDVHAIVGDISTLPDLPEPADVIACLYVLQFIEGERRKAALNWLARNLAPGGVLILGQKEVVSWAHACRFTETYFQFRRDNGYTQAEIDAKTKALRGAMWPVTQGDLEAELEERGLDYVETTRWLQFTSGVCTHRR